MTPHLPPGFAEFAALPDERLDLWTGAWWIARAEYPGLDMAPHVALVDEMGRSLRAGLAGAPADAGGRFAADDVAWLLRHVLHGQQRFTGNTTDYDDPRNSYLNDVLDRRLGIPISLSVVWMEVARRAGITLQGIGFPGHFLVRLDCGPDRRFLDPFSGGVELDRETLRERLRRTFPHDSFVSAGMLEPTPPRRILSRMLRNLKEVHLRREDDPRALRALDMLLAIDPDAGAERSERSQIQGRLARWN